MRLPSAALSLPVALAAALAAVYAAEVLLTDEVEHHRGSAAVVGVAFAATLAVRRTLPLLPLLAAACQAQEGLTNNGVPGSTSATASRCAA